MMPQNYRTDHQGSRPRFVWLSGLRAYGVVLVLIYHFFPDVLPGGFIGVDVFFVFSGFLITSLLVREFMDKGRVSPTAFYLRRIRRLLPALLAMLLITLPLALLVSPDYRTQVAQQAASALGWVTNFYEIAAGQSYADNLLPHLYTHTWTLGVEMQYYIVWAIVLSLVLPAFLKHLPNGKLSLNKSRHVLLIVAIVVSAASFLAMQLLVLGAPDPSAAYFNTLSHIYPLMIGSIVGIMAGYPRTRTVRLLEQVKPWLAIAIVAICLALIAVLAIMLDFENSLTYRLGILLTSLATAVVIAIGRGMQRHLIKLPELKPVSYLAEVSYSLYLFHWPLAIVCVAWSRQLTAVLDDSLALAISLTFAALGLLATFMLSHISYKFIEKPFSSSTKGTSTKGANPLSALREKWADGLQPSSATVCPSNALSMDTPQNLQPIELSELTTGDIENVAGEPGDNLFEPVTPSPASSDVRLASARLESIRLASVRLAGKIALPACTIALIALCAISISTAPRISSLDEALRQSTLAATTDQLNNTHLVLSSYAKSPVVKANGKVTIGMVDAVTKKDSITVIGDSVTIAPSKLIKERTGAKVDAKIGRNMTDGITLVKTMQDTGTLGTTVVIALATNTHAGSFDDAKKICEQIDPGHRIVFVTSYGVGKGEMAKLSTQLRDLPAQYNFVSIADWAAAISKQKKWLAEDGFHCDNQQSKELYAQVISDAITSAQIGPVS